MKRLLLLIILMCFLCGCGADEDVFVTSATEGTASDCYTDEVEGLSEKSDSDTICVYVCGQVLCPGVYELPVNSRAVEAVNAAGGMSDIADDTAVNLADILYDGQQLVIPEKLTGDPSQGNGASRDSPDGKININSGSLEQLEQIPGIGPTKAKSILEYRESNGRFLAPSDITKVSGIGEGTYEKIKDHIKV